MWDAPRDRLSAGDVLRAARCAGWLVFVVVNAGEVARSDGDAQPLEARWSSQGMGDTVVRRIPVSVR